jgi:hypothetical protein
MEWTGICTILFYTTDMADMPPIQRLWYMFNLKVRLIGPTWPDRLAQCLFVLLSQRVGIDPDQLALNLLAMSFERQILLFRICVTYNKSWHWNWDDVSCIRQASKARFGQSSALQRFQGWEQLRTSGARQDKEGSELEILEVLSVLHVLQA